MNPKKQKVVLEKHLVSNRIKMGKKANPNINIKNPNLNLKRIRGNNFEIEEKDDSNETHTETKDTIFGTRINKKVLTTSDSQKKENYLKIDNNTTKKFQKNKRANRFMRKKRERFIKFKKGNKKITETSSKNEEIELDSSISDNERIIGIPKKSFKKNKNKPRTNTNKIKNSKRKRFLRGSSINNYRGRDINNNDNSLEQRFINLEENLNEKINDVFELLQSQRNTIRNQNKKISNQGKTIKNQNNAIKKLKTKINDQDNTINNLNKEILDQNMKISLLSEIYNQSKINSNNMNNYIMHISKQFTCLFNSCKILFVRKICDFILEGLIQFHMKDLAKTADSFTNNDGFDFHLLVFKKNVKNKFIKNLIIDFLMEKKQYCSDAIHMNGLAEKEIPFMKELYFIILDKNEEQENNNFYISISDMTKIIFESNNKELIDSNEKQEEQSEINESDDEGSKLSDNYLNKNNNQIVDEGITINQICTDDLLKILKKELNNNKKGIENIVNKMNQEINSTHFYQFWLDSFENQNYKSSMEYEKFIRKNYIPSLTKMKEILVQLLPNYQIKFFSEDPTKFTGKVVSFIRNY